ncbi:hypothetical protein Pcinc_038311 [Petrolisthes cinctipes]|uniref:Uncharacterized protein n=1 Tax=Petrolisthes cinctipes TaxID=88211 RepID=A0AAE1BR94_PETCI|nr:hypothetical protein Pcinc_038311 [Petrolisthes cinctipes]
MLREGEVTGYTRHDVSEKSDVFLKAAAFEETLTTIRQAGVKKQANFIRGVSENVILNKKFLAFLMSRVCVNETGRYPHFPFLSLCGRERNYIRCDDLPYVFTHVIEGKTEGEEGQYYLTYNHAGNALTMPFQPSEICMEVGTGRVYHPAPPRVGGVGLLRSKLAIQLAPHFLFHGDDDQLPSHIVWDGAEVKLQHSLVHTLTKLQHLRQYSLGLNGTLPN